MLLRKVLQRSLVRALAVVGMLTVSAAMQPAQATLLGLTPASPNIFSFGITTSYVAGTKAFTATGFSSTLDGTALFSTGVSSLSAVIENDGTFTSGTLSILGMVASGDSGTLLTGILTAFGFGEPDDVFEFLFDVTGGSLAGLYGSQGGVILGGITGFSPSGTFTSDFGSGLPFGTSDTFFVPEPATTLLFATGLAFLGFARRRGVKTGGGEIS